jgi:hypothetical protein
MASKSLRRDPTVASAPDHAIDEGLASWKQQLLGCPLINSAKLFVPQRPDPRPKTIGMFPLSGNLAFARIRAGIEI